MVRQSLLKNVLQKNSEASGHEAPKALTSRKGLKQYAESIKSTGGSTIRSVRSIAESVASFYSLMTGGSRIPKRRRPEISRLGVPKFYRKNPKSMLAMEGVKYLDTEELGPWTSAHAKSFSSIDIDSGEAWGSIVLFSHASAEDPMPIFHGRAKISGEVRIVLRKPMKIASIDVWLQAKQECILDLAQQPFLNATANLWTPQRGDPRKISIPGMATVPLKGKLPPGTYVFPFEFPAFPRDVDVFQMDYRLNMPKHANVFLPPSHEISEVLGWVSWQKYVIGVNIEKPGITAINEEWDFKFDYFPRARPLLRPEVPFPFLLNHDEWPFSREELGGWSLTPFGGRGRFRDEMVEVEGILGIQAPVVYSTGQRVRFTILLWSENEEVLEAFAHQDNIQVDYIRSDIYGLDVLEPHNSARKNRLMLPYGDRGRIWRNDDGTAATPSVPAPQRNDKLKVKVRTKRAQDSKIIRSNYVPKRFTELYNANAEDIEDTTVMPVVPMFGAPQPEGPSQAAMLVMQQQAREDAAEPTTVSNNAIASSSIPVLGALDTNLDTSADHVSPQSPNESLSSYSPRDENPLDSISKLAIDASSAASLSGLGDAQSAITAVDADGAPSVKGSTITEERPVSPTPSLEDEDDEAPEKKGRIIRLDGDIVVPMSMPPSYRYLYAGVEYSIHIIITHPDYSHISPRATGILAEAPIWIVTDPPRQPGEEDSNTLHTPVDLARLPKSGEAIRVPADAIRLPLATGDATKRVRPTQQGNRTWSFF